MSASWFIDISNEESRGFVRDFFSTTLQPRPRFTRNETRRRNLYFVTPANVEGKVWTEIDPADVETVRVGVGPVDDAPTGGTWALSANGTSTGLTALAYNVSAATLEAALDAIEPVTVTKTGDYLFSITVTATNTAITWTSNASALTPPSVINIDTVTAPAVGVQAVYAIRLIQSPYAYSVDWTPRDDASDAVAIATVNAGSGTTPARYRVTISPDPVGGSFRVLSAEKQTVKVRVQPNTATAQVWTLDPVADTAGSLTGLYFDLPDNSDTTERFWIDVNNGGTSAPATPSGGSLTEITTIVSNDSKATVAGKLADAINAHGHFSVVVDEDSLLTITAATAGAKTASKTSSGTSGFTIAIDTLGLAGQLQGQGFVLDDAAGTCGVYITVGGLPAAPPAFAAACTRSLAVAVAGGATASTAGGNIETALDADGAWTSTNASGLVTIVDAAVGTRAGTTTVSDDSYFSTTVSQAGFSIVATVPHDSTAQALEAQLVDEDGNQIWTVKKTDAYAWVLTRTALLTPTAPTVEDDSLTWLIGFTGTLPFNTLALHQAFANTTDSELDAIFEVKLTLTGESEEVALNIPARLTRDLLNSDLDGVTPYPLTLGLLWLPNVTGYTGGGVTNLDGVSTVGKPVGTGAMFYHSLDGYVGYKLFAGTTAESSPGVIRPDDYNASTNAKVWVAG